MTNDEINAFIAGLSKLCVMYRVKSDKSMQRIYFEALKDVPLDLLLLAMKNLLAHGGDFMPTATRIRQAVDEVQAHYDADERERLLRAPDRLLLAGDVSDAAPRGPFCYRCDDTGKRRTCPGCTDVVTCTKTDGIYCPEFKEGRYSLPVMTCECAATNPEIMRKRKLETKRERFSKKPIARRRDRSIERNFTEPNE